MPTYTDGQMAVIDHCGFDLGNAVRFWGIDDEDCVVEQVGSVREHVFFEGRHYVSVAVGRQVTRISALDVIGPVAMPDVSTPEATVDYILG